MTSADRDAPRINLERDLRELLHAAPSPELRRAMDGQMSAALEATADAAASHRGRWARHRSVAMLAAVIALVTLAGVVGAEALRDPNEPRGYPGITNPGQPFWNTPILEMTPLDAHRFAEERGYSATWQVDDRHGTADPEDDTFFHADAPPECGDVVGGAMIDGILHLHAEQNAPEAPASTCP